MTKRELVDAIKDLNDDAVIVLRDYSDCSSGWGEEASSASAKTLYLDSGFCASYHDVQSPNPSYPRVPVDCIVID